VSGFSAKELQAVNNIPLLQSLLYDLNLLPEQVTAGTLSFDRCRAVIAHVLAIIQQYDKGEL